MNCPPLSFADFISHWASIATILAFAVALLIGLFQLYHYNRIRNIEIDKQKYDLFIKVVDDLNNSSGKTGLYRQMCAAYMLREHPDYIELYESWLRRMKEKGEFQGSELPDVLEDSIKQIKKGCKRCI